MSENEFKVRIEDFAVRVGKTHMKENDNHWILVAEDIASGIIKEAVGINERDDAERMIDEDPQKYIEIFLDAYAKECDILWQPDEQTSNGFLIDIYRNKILSQ